MNNSFKKVFLIIAGSVSLALGIIGIIVPVLPTTPFLLLSSYCYLKSSERLYNWLLNHKVFGSYIRNYLTDRAVKKSVKIVSVIFLWLSLGISAVFVDSVSIRILLFIIGVAVSIHLIRLKTLREK